MLVDEHGELCFRARYGETLPEDKTARIFKPGEGIAGWVLQNRMPHVCYDTRTDRILPPS